MEEEEEEAGAVRAGMLDTTGRFLCIVSIKTIRHHIRVPRIALVLLWLLQVYHRRQLPIKGPPPPAKSSSFAYAYRGGVSGDGGGANEGHKLGN